MGKCFGCYATCSYHCFFLFFADQRSILKGSQYQPTFVHWFSRWSDHPGTTQGIYHLLIPTISLPFSFISFHFQFLTRGLSMYATSLSSKPGDSSENNAHKTKSVDDWPTVILWLGNELGMDVDCLRRHYVSELYSAGMDGMASEVWECSMEWNEFPCFETVISRFYDGSK